MAITWPRTILPQRVTPLGSAGPFRSRGGTGKDHVAASRTRGRQWTEIYPPIDMSTAAARTLLATIEHAWRTGATVALVHPGHPTRLGGGTGSPLVNGAGQSGATLVTDGWTGTNPVLRAGDLLTVAGVPYTLRVTADASASAGAATLAIDPPIAAADAPVDNAALTVAGVVLQAYLASAPSIPTVDEDGFLRGLAVTFLEAHEVSTGGGGGSIVDPPTLTLTTAPAGAIDNVAFTTQPQVTVSPVASGVVITASIVSGTGSLIGTATATTNAAGVASWTNLGIDAGAPPSIFTLQFTSPGITSVNSGSLTVSAAGASALVVTRQPADATDNVAFLTQPQVSLSPATAGVTITAAILSGTGSMIGTATAVTNASGVATWVNLGIDAVSTPSLHVLRFSAGGYTSADSVAFSVYAVGGGGDAFSQEAVYVGGGWQTVTDLTWPSVTGKVIPHALEYDPDTFGTGLIDYGNDWGNSGGWVYTSPVTRGDTVINVSGPANTTLNAAVAAGAWAIPITTTPAWTDNFCRLKIGTDPTIYTANYYLSTATSLRLSRPLAQSHSAGAAVVFQPFVEPGDQVFLFNAAQTFPPTFASFERRTVLSRTNTTVTFTEPVINNYAQGGRPIPDRWTDTCTVLDDPAYPGASNVLQQDLVTGFPGGFAPAKVGRRPGNSDYVLQWATGLFQTEMYAAAWYRAMPGFNMDWQGGLKTIYYKSPLNGIAHMFPLLLTDENGGSQMWPVMIPQGPTNRYACPATAQNNINDGAWHRVEWWLKANTGGNADGELKLWIDGRLEINRTDCKWFDDGAVRDISLSEVSAIYGGGANISPQDQWLRYGRILAKVR
jgi:hypothetical protein